MDHKEAAEKLLRLDNPPACVVVFHDGNKPFFYFGGDTLLGLGMATYASEALKEYAAKRMPLVQVSGDMSKFAPGGDA